MLKIINPATGDVVRDIPSDTADSIKAKYEAAARAQKGWAARSASDRTSII